MRKKPVESLGWSVDQLEWEFRRYVAQTSDEPMGIIVEKARGSTIIAKDGRRYLDFLAGIGVANVGHANPSVVKAVKEQAERYLHVMVYGEVIQEPQVELARLLAERTPEPLSVTYFTNSGAEAVEGALKTARKYTGRHRIIAFEGSYHGGTLGALSALGNGRYRKPFEPLVPGVTFLPFDHGEALEAIDRETAAVIVEPIQGEGGVLVPSDDFLQALRKRCDGVGALLLFDEVMTGFGRTGRLFAFEHWGIVPDLLVMAKAMGGGMPLGGFMGRPEVMRTLAVDPPLSHLTTFGGHPVSCAAGLAALRYLLKHRLFQRAEKMGLQLQEGLRRLSEIGGVREIRGRGLLIGLELATPQLAQSFLRFCFEEGLLLTSTLHDEATIRLAPPLTVTASEVEQALEIMGGALRWALSSQPSISVAL